jgi:RND family efflux transporter MFP subunit
LLRGKLHLQSLFPFRRGRGEYRLTIRLLDIANVPSKFLVLLILLVTRPPSIAEGADSSAARGLTEPYRHIDVAAVEAGVIAEMIVREGEAVAQGQPLAKLDSELLNALLAIAQQSKEARGRLRAARAEVKLKEERAKSFAKVFDSGHARPEEVRRAATDLEIARAQLLAAEEDLVLKHLEYEKIQAQIDRRTVRAPIAGVVSKIHKEQAEFVAPNDPAVLTLVQLDPLLAVFSLTTQQASNFSVGQDVTVLMPGFDASIGAKVQFIAPVTDAESGTVLVKVRVDNSSGAHRSGTRCTLQLPSPAETSEPLASESANAN